MNATNEIEIVLSVLRDGQRNDRYLRRAEDGHLFTTPDHTFLTSDGVEIPPAVKIPVAYDSTEEEETELAEQLIADLDERIEDAE